MHRIFIVEDHLVMRQQYAAFLERENTLEICGEATNMKDALDKIPASNPDLVIVDISLDGEKDGIDLARSLRVQYADLRLLVVSGHEGATYAGMVVDSGANGYVVKGDPDAFIEAIHQVLEKGKYIPL
ncbi:MAG: response regulator transcription factor [Caldilineaceae bacterium]|nr:response regulator transcription factor [Caldilineaceae bacterium]